MIINPTDIPKLYKSLTMRIMTILLTLYYFIDTNPEMFVNLITLVSDHTEQTALLWLDKYNKMVLILTFVATAYGRARTEVKNQPLKDR